MDVTANYLCSLGRNKYFAFYFWLQCIWENTTGSTTQKTRVSNTEWITSKKVKLPLRLATISYVSQVLTIWSRKSPPTQNCKQHRLFSLNVCACVSVYVCMCVYRKNVCRVTDWYSKAVLYLYVLVTKCTLPSTVLVFHLEGVHVGWRGQERVFTAGYFKIVEPGNPHFFWGGGLGRFSGVLDEYKWKLNKLCLSVVDHMRTDQLYERWP